MKSNKSPIKKLTLKIGQETYSFDADLFDLEIHNIGVLNEQIAAIPGHIAWVGQVLGRAERQYESLKTARDVWLLKKLTDYSGEKSEKAKMALLVKETKGEYDKWESKVADARETCALLEAYKKGMESKFSLSQTISANIRLERESAYYRGQKGPRKLGAE